MTKPNLVLLRDGVWYKWTDVTISGKPSIKQMGTSVILDGRMYVSVTLNHPRDTRIRQAIENSPGPHTDGQYEVVDDMKCDNCDGNGFRVICPRGGENAERFDCDDCHGSGTVPTLRLLGESDDDAPPQNSDEAYDRWKDRQAEAWSDNQKEDKA